MVSNITWCRQPHSRCWWSLWSTPDWTMEIACWLACRLTYYVSSSRSWMQPPVWFIVYLLRARDHITHTRHWLRAPERIAYYIKLLFWHTKPCMEAQHAISVRWSMSLTYPVDQHSALLDRTVWGYRRSNCQPSTVERFRSQQYSSGTGCPTMSRQPIRCRLSGSNGNTRCSSSHSQTLSRDILNCNTHSGPSSGIAT